MSLDIREKIISGITYFDGGMGTMLQKSGLGMGELPENYNITNKDIVISIHKQYLEAGANIITTNTFGANELKFDNYEEIIRAALENAKEAVKQTDYFGTDRYVALDIGPLGKVLKPLGDMDFEDAVSIFSNVVKAGEKYGADVILIETMSNLYELKAAVLAAKENSSLPIFATCAFDERGKLMTGASPSTVVSMLEGMGVTALGVNCSLGPVQMRGIVDEILEKASVPVIVSPNAGLPARVNGETVYDINEDEFSDIMREFAEKGVRILGGCCGTTPSYIEKTVNKTKNIKIKPIEEKNITSLTGYADYVEINEKPILIGERINPTGKPKFKQALRDNDIAYILNEGIVQEEKGADILDVNVGLPEIDEVTVLKNAVYELQGVTSLPLQIDTSDAKAMENAMRIYNGKPLVNSVNGKESSMKEIFPLVRKYGGAVIALTLDENGIPDNSDDRVKIAEKIISTAESYGIKKKDIIVDPLCMTVSSNNQSAVVTLETVSKLTEMGIKTCLGVSNVSFGLPSRESANSVFFAAALQSGLKCAIINPFSEEMMKTYVSFNALKGLDKNCEKYIEYFSDKEEKKTAEAKTVTLKTAIIKGVKNDSAKLAEEMLKTVLPLDIISGEIVPALDEVGKGFEKNKVFLPQLLMSAEAAKSAFEVLKKSMSTSEDKQNNGKVILATVKGDIHDIGKNIVKVLLENYGFEVIDLGKDVPCEKIVQCARENSVKLVGLSALMTTTVSSMEETIKLLKDSKIDCKTVVGGAVLTKEYAQSIGADFYAKDAMETVRYAQKILVNSELA